MSKNIKYLSMFFGALFLFAIKVNAAPSITSVEHKEKDLYYVKANANGSTIKRYIVGTSLKSAISFNTSYDETYITVPNGTFYIWVESTSGETSSPYTIYVTDSCSNTTAYNKTDTGSYERCFYRYSNGTEKVASEATAASCATGYNMDAAYTTISQNDCGNKNPGNYGLSYRFCKKTYDYKCVKVETSSSSGNGTNTDNSQASTANAKLSSLSISTGSLTPNFSPSTFSYAATTDQSAVTINATLANSTASFVNGYGPRTINLNYGTNTIEIRTQDGNTTNTYTIKIKRSDSRSSENTLSSLTISKGSLDPVFSSLTTSYTVMVDSDVDKVDIGATLSNSSSSFVENYGPRTVELNYGYTRAAIKVKSESGSVRTYSILFGRNGEGVSLEKNNKALLESLELSSGTLDFDSNTFDYNVSVTYDVTNINVEAKAMDESDEVVVTGGENLEADKLNEINVIVTSSDGKYTNTYTIYVIRKNEDLGVSNNSLLSNLSVEGYKIKFDAKVTDYTVKIKEDVSSLNITATPADDRATVTVEGNENLTNGSEIKIRVKAEDGSYTDYFIEVKRVGQGGNVFLTVIVVILIILVLAYLVLRAMGYKIYFNIGAVKDKIVGIFKRK